MSKNQLLERLIAGLLLVVGIALIVESILPEETGRLLPNATATDIIAGLLFVLGIGLVSSLLGVAGGGHPTLIFAYGADIKVAGTASLLISLPRFSSESFATRDGCPRSPVIAGYGGTYEASSRTRRWKRSGRGSATGSATGGASLMHSVRKLVGCVVDLDQRSEGTDLWE